MGILISGRVPTGRTLGLTVSPLHQPTAERRWDSWLRLELARRVLKPPPPPKGTGVAIYVQDKLNAVINEQVSGITENLETLFVTTQNNCNEATFGVIYRPPSGNFSSFLNELSIILEHLPKKSTYIMGDFNINLHVNNKNVSDFEEVMFTTGFLPLISTYTHEKPGCNKTCIDNIYSNDLNKCIASGTISDRISHHLPIFHIFDGLSTSKSESNDKYVQYYDYCDSNVRQFITS